MLMVDGVSKPLKCWFLTSYETYYGIYKRFIRDLNDVIYKSEI